MQNDYTTIKLPTNLILQIDEHIDKTKLYTSRTDLMKDALRRFLRQEGVIPQYPEIIPNDNGNNGNNGNGKKQYNCKCSKEEV